MGDFSGDVLREVSLPLAEKPANSIPVSLTNGNRHRADIRIKVHILNLLARCGQNPERIYFVLPVPFLPPRVKMGDLFQICINCVCWLCFRIIRSSSETNPLT